VTVIGAEVDTAPAEAGRVVVIPVGVDPDPPVGIDVVDVGGLVVIIVVIVVPGVPVVGTPPVV
jgi:hypothetical protein